MKIGFIGCGKMANVLIGSFIDAEMAAPEHIICSDINIELLNNAREIFGVSVTSDNSKVFAEADIIFLATKPQGFADAVSGQSENLRNGHLLVSIMAGITIAKIKATLNAPVIRVMPNVACLIGQMAAGFTVGDDVPADQAEYVAKLLNCAGHAIQVEESQLDAVTGLSGSGPAFVAYLIQAFIDAGVKDGLDPDVARSLAIQTFVGTAHMLREKDIQPDKLIEMVSSPNGTTVAGRAILESSDVADVISKTVSRAAQRSSELSN